MAGRTEESRRKSRKESNLKILPSKVQNSLRRVEEHNAGFQKVVLAVKEGHCAGARRVRKRRKETGCLSEQGRRKKEGLFVPLGAGKEKREKKGAQSVGAKNRKKRKKCFRAWRERKERKRK